MTISRKYTVLSSLSWDGGLAMRQLAPYTENSKGVKLQSTMGFGRLCYPKNRRTSGSTIWKLLGFLRLCDLFIPQPTKVPCSIWYICSTKKSSLSNCKHPCCQHGTSPRHLLIATHEATMGLRVGCGEGEALMLHCYWRGDDVMLRTGLAVWYLCISCRSGPQVCL